MYSFKQCIQDRINNIEVKNTWCTETFRIGACWFRVCIIWIDSEFASSEVLTGFGVLSSHLIIHTHKHARSHIFKDTHNASFRDLRDKRSILFY